MIRTNLNQNSIHLEAFIKFLKEERFDDACETYLELVKAAHLPLFSFYSHLPSADLLITIRENLREFLNGILDGTIISKHPNKISDWKSDSLKFIPREKINISDILLINSIRKQLLLYFLPEFSKEVRVATSVMTAIEELLVVNDQATFEAYVEIQQQAISEKTEFFSKLIENSINGVWVVDPDFKIMEWNPVMEKELNISRSSAIGKNIYELIPHFKETNLGLALSNVLRDSVKIISRDNQFPLRRGWYDSFITPLFNQQGEIKMILCILLDITRRKEIENKLQEHKEELQATNEELLEQQGELQKAYFELQNKNKKLLATKNALKENEARLREAQAIAHLGSWEYDIQNNKIYWSEEMKKIFGYEVNEPLDYETYLQLLHPEDLELVNGIIANTMKTQEPYSFEHRIIRKDGTLRYLIANGRAILSDKNEVIKLQGTGLDITNLKLLELERNEDQYFIQKITETTPDLITVFDLGLKETIYSNRLFFESLGYSTDEANSIRRRKAEGIKEVLHPDDYEKARNFFGFFRTYSGGETKELECRYRKKNGDWIWIWTRYKVFKRSEEGLAVQLLGISRDITQRKRTEDKILENEARLKESQLLAQLGYWEFDLVEDSVFWSDELFRIYSIPKKSSLKLKEITSHLFPQDKEKLKQAIEKSILTGEPYQLEYRILRNGEEVRYLNSKGEIIKDQNGEIVKIRGIAQDITEKKMVAQKLESAYDQLKETHEELKRSEEALKVLNNELESRVSERTEALQDTNRRLVKINTDLDNFIYTASHDLKVPIANIEGLLSILKKKVGNKIQDNDKIILNMMEESVCRFNTTIKDLTQISKVQKDLEEENNEKISLSDTINNLIPDIAGLIAEKNSKIYTSFEVDEITFTKKNLRSILYNLIVNSLKYCSDERLPEIRLSSTRSDEGVVLSIADNGMGVPANQLGKIFSLFKRYHTNIEGSGIGLYIVKRIVENSGGRIEVTSEINIGTTFNIIFTNKN